MMMVSQPNTPPNPPTYNAFAYIGANTHDLKCAGNGVLQGASHLHSGNGALVYRQKFPQNNS